MKRVLKLVNFIIYSGLFVFQNNFAMYSHTSQELPRSGEERQGKLFREIQEDETIKISVSEEKIEHVRDVIIKICLYFKLIPSGEDIIPLFLRELQKENGRKAFEENWDEILSQLLEKVGDVTEFLDLKKQLDEEENELCINMAAQRILNDQIIASNEKDTDVKPEEQSYLSELQSIEDDAYGIIQNFVNVLGDQNIDEQYNSRLALTKEERRVLIDIDGVLGTPLTQIEINEIRGKALVLIQNLADDFGQEGCAPGSEQEKEAVESCRRQLQLLLNQLRWTNREYIAAVDPVPVIYGPINLMLRDAGFRLVEQKMGEDGVIFEVPVQELEENGDSKES